MNDLQVHHLKEELCDALTLVAELRTDNTRLKRKAETFERSGDYVKLQDKLFDARGDLQESKERVRKLERSVANWKNKYMWLKDRVDKLSFNLSKGDSDE